MSGQFGADIPYMSSRTETVVAIGSKYIQMDGDDEKNFYY